MVATSSISHDFGQTAFDAADCESVLRGERLPQNLGNRVAQLCLIRGIRKHADFARSAAVTDLCGMEGQEIFARARNARLIMSDEVPSLELMHNTASHPYCIWYPDVASEDTYRKVAAAFPGMRYQVGRACAVAGYARLYRELDLLPDPSIAEEAREAWNNSNNEGSHQIYEQIMAAPARYNVLDDYNLAVKLDGAKPGAFLNADTAVRASLDARQRFGQHFGPSGYFNITEDWGIDEETVELEKPRLTNEEIDLLVSPLPVDLPTMQKDLLILVSAYEGNLDRYARLRRPGRSLEYEFHCLVPGVYRSTAMAFWLERNPDVMDIVASAWDPDEVTALRRAIHARHIMNNDTSRLLNAKPPVPDEELPYWIWYPTIPSAYTLYKLAEARPAMRPQCARACIAGGYRKQYTQIMDMPDPTDDDQVPLAADEFINREADGSVDHKFFVADLEHRRQERGLQRQRRAQHDRWRSSIPWREGDTSSTALYGQLRDGHSFVVHEGQDWGMWELLGAELGRVRLHLSTPQEVRAEVTREGGYKDLRG